MLTVAIRYRVDAVVVAVRVSLDQRAALIPRVLIRGKLARRIRTCYRVDDDLVEVAQPVITRLPRVLALRYAGNVDAVVRPQIDDDLLCRVVRADQLAVARNLPACRRDLLWSSSRFDRLPHRCTASATRPPRSRSFQSRWDRHIRKSIPTFDFSSNRSLSSPWQSA